MTKDLAAFLRARLDEDERTARTAASLCGCHPPVPAWQFDDVATDGRILIADDPHPATDVSPSRLRKRWNGSYANLHAAEHIARHDPARVLRQVAGKRRILAWATGSGHLLPTHETDYVLTMLVQPYATHPDFRPEWAA